MIDFSGVLYLDAEKIKNKGEDALTFKFDKYGNGYMAVFDGSGGAGSERHPELDNRKSAYIASRSCAYYFDYLIGNLNNQSPLKNVDDLSWQLYSYLVKINNQYPMDKFESTLVDILPTTICGAFIKNKQNNISVDFIWAGDSRGYIIDENGLSQVTEDDVDSKDAYYNIFDDSIMNNRIHGNSEKERFQIHTTNIDLKSKGIIICATDGCYDYFNSPMVFEFFFISMIATSDNFLDVEKKLLEVLKKTSGDDCSLIASFYGFSDYSEIKEFIQNRFEFLSKDKDVFDEKYWNENYKSHYYRYNKMRGVVNAGD